MTASTTPPSPLVTVIVPFLNAEATLKRALTSILEQDFDDYELIMINDGSTDRSFDIANDVLTRYPDKVDKTRMFFRTHRHGLAAGQHLALTHATGRYVIRVDADDELTAGALRSLVTKAVDNDSDIVMGPYILVAGDKEKTVAIDHSFPDINRMALIVDNYSLWNKLLRRQLLLDNNIWPTPGLDCWEDLIVTGKAFAAALRVDSVDTPVYRYYRNPGEKTLSRAPRDKQLRQHLLAANEIERWFIARGDSERYREFLDRLKLIAKVKYLRGPRKDVAAWKSAYPEVNRRVMSITRVPLIYRILFRTVAALPTRLTQRVADWCDKFYRQ